MEDKNKLSDDVRAAPEQGSGALLAAERKAQKKTVEEVAQQLNLSATQIRTIELDQSEGLPEPTYVRGYIRSYANLLGLNAEQVLEHYLNPNWQKGTRLDDLPKGMTSGASTNAGDHRGFFTVGKSLMLAILIGLSVFMWKTGRLDTFLGGKTSPIVTSVESSVGAEDTSSAPIMQDLGTLATQSEEGLELAESDSSEQVDTNPELELTADDEVISHNLVLSFTDTSWIDIRDSEGKRLAYKSYTGGEDLSVSSTLPISVFIGNAKAVSVTYNNADFDLAAHREGVFARFSLGE